MHVNTLYFLNIYTYPNKININWRPALLRHIRVNVLLDRIAHVAYNLHYIFVKLNIEDNGFKFS